MIRRNDLVAYAVAGAAIVAFAILLVFALVRLAGTEAEMRENEGDNMLWAISRAHVAALLLDAEITRKAGLRETGTEVQRRYNVLLSRLTLLTEGPQLRYMRDLGFDDDLAAADRAIRAVEVDILGLSYGDVDAAMAIHRILEPLIEDLGRAGNQSMVRQWEATGARLDRQRASIIQVIVSIIALIILGVVLAVVMLRTMAQRQRLLHSFIREQEIAETYRSFVALASHQFRTPLAVIDSTMQRLLRSGDRMRQAEIAERARNVRAEVSGLNDLIGTALDVVRLDAGQVRADPADCNITMLVDNVRSRQLQATPGRAITTHIGDEVPATLETDPLLAGQVLDNLLSNAIKYSPPTEPVAIRVTAENRQIVFAVEDRGIGIPEDERENLFGRFFRASTARHIPGTGVGLSIASQLTRLLGGELEFASRAGIGSTFVLRLPNEWAARDAKADAEQPSG
ncbi:MAG: HAMP domain-containing histidine kinase [Rhodocyclaceae bacterium]|nr:HAMP domain-containing histidine kinase [Rhodocyclaceae bacterium]